MEKLFALRFPGSSFANLSFHGTDGSAKPVVLDAKNLKATVRVRLAYGRWFDGVDWNASADVQSARVLENLAEVVDVVIE